MRQRPLDAGVLVIFPVLLLGLAPGAADDRGAVVENQDVLRTDPPARTTCALQLSNGNGVEIECIALAGESPS